MAAEVGALDADEAAAFRAAPSEPKTEPSTAAAATQPEVDAESPWLGLASFTEETRAFFHGRDEEIAELARRVQRKLLTVLFGQSGLGKTSILRAGIVPRLRPAGYCPVYVRLDYSPDSPPPAEQIKQAIFRATHALGEWTQPGIAEEGESLWEFLHHRDDVLKDDRGKTVIPLLIFDQFEEIFTLAQSDDAGKARAALFLEELADLVENRPPKALEARLEHDDSKAERFDFTRADYRILIALREDYLAHLEGVKGAMPSITQNRMRLARMTGQQALSAVMKPGGKLVSQEVAESIVRFIAGGSELANAEVEPSLLSLICHELNNARIAQGRSEISADLLAGSNETILAEFYERALADQPAAVRRFIEDEMLTESGFRESLAEERVLRAFAAAGAAPKALATLVDRRLLRIEERLDVRRVELTHDVLCGVVGASREVRHEREARDEAERQLAAQKARETATRKSLVRARQIAAVCAVLAIGAIASALWGYQSARRAQSAEASAQHVRGMAEVARGESEKLIVYLLDDFYQELEPIGRLDIVAELANRALAYYRELPPELRTPETERNRALARVRLGAVLRVQSKLDEADVALTDAVNVLSALRKQGDASEITLLGLAKARWTQAAVLGIRGHANEAIRADEDALELLKPLSSLPNASRVVRLTEGSILVHMGWARALRGADGTSEIFRRAQDVLRGLGAVELRDLAAAAAYAEAGIWLGQTLMFDGREAEAKEAFQEAIVLAGRVVDARPGHMPAMRSKAFAGGGLALIETDNLRMAPGLALDIAHERMWEDFLKLDSSNSSAGNNLSVARSSVADDLFRMGRIEESIRKRQEVVRVAETSRMSGFLASNLAIWNGWLAEAYANLPGSGAADSTLAIARKFVTLAGQRASDDRILPAFVSQSGARVLFANGAYREALEQAQAGIRVLQAASIDGKPQQDRVWRLEINALRIVADSAYALGDYAASEAAARKALELRLKTLRGSLLDEVYAAENRMDLAQAIARQGRLKEAEEAMRPVLKFQRELQARRSEDLVRRVDLSRALLVSALAVPAERNEKLAEAAATMDRLPAEVRRWKPYALLRAEIAAEQKKRP